MTKYFKVRWLIAATMIVAIALPAYADFESDCHRTIGKSVARLRKAHQKRISKCLRFGNYDCPADWLVIDQAENRLRARLTEPGTDCEQAVNTDGLPVSSFGPTSCPDSWNNCDVATPAITTLADLAECLVCIETGHDRRVRSEIDFPATIADLNVRVCVRGAYEGMAQAVRVAMHQVERCIDDIPGKPFNCPVDFSPDSSVAPILDRLALNSSRCLVNGVLPDEVDRLCNKAMVGAGDVTECIHRLTKCMACEVTNSTWGQSQDCAAVSGDWTCNGDSPPDPGSFFVANGVDDTVTFFEPDGAYAGADLAAATHAVGSNPSALVANRLVNALTVASRTTDSVTYLNASTGEPANGDIPSSSFAAADAPAAIAVDDEYGFVFAVGETSGQATLLDATDGSYVYETQPASTIDTIAGATRVALDEIAHVLFVLSPASDTVVAIRSSDGSPRGGTLAASTFALGIDADAIAADAALGILYIASTATDSITLFDAVTLAPEFGTLGASTFTVGDGPVAVATDDSLHRVFVANAGDESVTILDGTSGAYANGTLAASTVTLASAPIDVAVHSGLHRVYVLAPPSGVTLINAATGAYVSGTLAASTFATSTNANAIAVID